MGKQESHVLMKQLVLNVFHLYNYVKAQSISLEILFLMEQVLMYYCN